jgi:hypothetical protein
MCARHTRILERQGRRRLQLSVAHDADAPVVLGNEDAAIGRERRIGRLTDVSRDLLQHQSKAIGSHDRLAGPRVCGPRR